MADKLPKGWRDVGSDICWEDHGGTWARPGPKEGTWIFVRFINIWVDCGKEAKRDGMHQYEASLSLVTPGEVDAKTLASMRRSMDVPADADPIWIATGLHDYGCKAPLDAFTSNTGPVKLRGQAFKAGTAYVTDEQGLAKRLRKKVNAIGSTAAECGRGDVLAGLKRYADEGKHGTDPKMDLMLQLGMTKE